MQTTPLSIQLKPANESTGNENKTGQSPNQNGTETIIGMTKEPEEGQSLKSQDAPEGAFDTPIPHGTDQWAKQATEEASSGPPVTMESQMAETASPEMGQTPAGDKDTPPGAAENGLPGNETVTINGIFMKENEKYFLENNGDKTEIVLGGSIPLGGEGTSSFEGRRVYITGVYTDSTKSVIKADTIIIEPDTTGGQSANPEGAVITIAGMVTKKSDGGYQLKKNGTNEIIPLSINEALFEGPDQSVLDVDGKQVVFGGTLSNGVFYVKSIFSVQ